MSLNKRGGIELSMTTIVIIVISIIILVFGIIFGRNVMCSGIQLTENVNSGVQNQLKVLFSEDKYGVSCEGEGSQEIKLGSGGRRKVVCEIKMATKTDFKLQYKADIVSLNAKEGGASNSEVKKWVLGSGTWTGKVSPGGDGSEAPVITLDIPSDAPSTLLQLSIEEYRDGNDEGTHTIQLEVVPAGFFRTTLC